MPAPKNPKGAKSDKEWRDALRLALHEEYDDKREPGAKSKALRLVARSVVEKAIEGDIAAAKEIGDRLDGKPAQTVAVSGDMDHRHEHELSPEVEELVNAALQKSGSA